MIHVVRPASDSAPLPGPRWTLDDQPDPRRPWNGVRRLLDRCHEYPGPRRFETVAARYRAATDLVLAGRADGGGLGARLDSHLSHNFALQRPLFDGWAKVLKDLLEGSGATLVVSNLCRLDWETMAALKALYRNFPRRGPGFRIGYRARAPAPEPDDQGIRWGMLPEYLARSILDFQILPEARTEPGRGREEPGPPAPANPRTPSVAEIEACFRSFAFTPALRLGLDLLETKPRLEDRQAATVHAIVALCAHNRQFHSAGNRTLADFVQRHLEAALEVEDRPVLRCALWYRLAVTLGRRKGELDAAMAAADRAVSAAGAKELTGFETAYQEAWARNIRAFVHMRSGRIDEGRRNLRIAFEGLGLVDPSNIPDGNRALDLALTRTLAAGNLSALSNMAGDRAGARRWRGVGYAVEKDEPALEYFEAGQWFVLCRDFHLPRLGLPQVRKGIRSARRENDALWLHRLLVAGADLNDRLGRPHSAARLYRAAHGLFRKVGGSRILDRVELRAAAACSRAGRFGEARHLLIEALADRRSVEMRVRVHGAMARVAARAGVTRTAEASLDQAFDAAQQAGRTDLPIQVHAAAGRVLQRLGDPRRAREHLRSALELAGGPADDASPVVLLSVLLGLEEIGPPEPPRLARILELLPQALLDVETWWVVPRLLKLIADSAPWAAVEPLVLAACQRRDCRRSLERLVTDRPQLEKMVVECRTHRLAL